MDRNEETIFQEPSSAKKKKPGETWEWIKALIIAVLLALLIRQFLFAPFIVDGESMMPNLLNNERLIVNKIVYTFGKPERGEIIVFHATEEKDYIKRVIGLPGDKVQLIDDKLMINDKPVEEPYLKAAIARAETEGHHYNNRDYGPVVVPEGHIIVFGDNRPNSQDSRDLGPISMDRIVGKADLVFWPLSEFHRIQH